MIKSHSNTEIFYFGSQSEALSALAAKTSGLYSCTKDRITKDEFLGQGYRDAVRAKGFAPSVAYSVMHGNDGRGKVWRLSFTNL